MVQISNASEKSIHVGSIIKEYLTINKVSKAALARKLNIDNSVITSYQKRAGGNIATLIALSHALKHNFFADLAAFLPESYSKTEIVDDSNIQKIAQLERENEDLKLEKALLLQVIGNK